MGRSRRSPGLVKRRGIWHIDKWIEGRRVCQSTGSDKLAEAERYLARLRECIRKAEVYGVRPTRTFDEAAAKFVKENQHKRSLNRDVCMLKQLMPFIGHLPINRVHRGTLDPWVDFKREEGRAPATINHGLKVVRRILRLAEYEWMDEHGLSWLERERKRRKQIRSTQPLNLSTEQRQQTQ